MKPGMKQLLAAVIAVFFRIAICVHGFSVASALPALSPVITSQKPQRPKSSRMRSAGKESFTANMDKDSSSKRSLLRFAIPALGIYLSNPLLSNIDNIFVGRTAGTKALAAMSPATTLTDLLLMTFSFLGRAATGIVTRAYALKEGKGNTEAASKAASARKCFSFIDFLSTFFFLIL
jgi:Na+-driven multidrug efflux pump